MKRQEDIILQRFKRLSYLQGILIKFRPMPVVIRSETKLGTDKLLHQCYEINKYIF